MFYEVNVQSEVGVVMLRIYPAMLDLMNKSLEFRSEYVSINTGTIINVFFFYIREEAFDGFIASPTLEYIETWVLNKLQITKLPAPEVSQAPVTP
jgi:hypothetical protein